MPRLSLYKPEKGNDYKFIDRQASEMFQVGGTDVYLHKYLGAASAGMNTPDQPNIVGTNVANIQDLLFLENRDRNYDPEIYRIRGIYNVQNIDFNLSQFGLFIDNDTLYMTVHINDFIKYIGRKPISGDVLELPHLRDDFALNDFDISLPRYYVIEDVGRASEGFSITWYPHLYRLKLKRITDSQQFAQIFNAPVLDANGDPATDGTTLKDLLSTYNQEIEKLETEKSNIKDRINEINKEENELMKIPYQTEEGKAAFSKRSEISEEKQKLYLDIKDLDVKIIHAKNVGKAVSNGGTTRLYSSTLSGYYPTGLIGSDILCLTSGSLKFSIQSKAPYAGSPTPLPGSVSSGGWVSVSYVGSVQ